MNNRLEFYNRDKLVVSVPSAIVPPVRSLVSIRGKTWKVASVTYAVDHSEANFRERIMRANIDVVEVYDAPRGKG